MSYCAELVTFRLTVAAEEFLELRRAAITQVKAAHPGLVDVPFCGERSDGSWIDLWIYETEEAAEAANADAPNLGDFMKMAGVLDGVEIEVTAFPEAGVSPIG